LQRVDTVAIGCERGPRQVHGLYNLVSVFGRLPDAGRLDLHVDGTPTTQHSLYRLIGVIVVENEAGDIAILRFGQCRVERAIVAADRCQYGGVVQHGTSGGVNDRESRTRAQLRRQSLLILHVERLWRPDPLCYAGYATFRVHVRVLIGTVETAATSAGSQQQQGRQHRQSATHDQDHSGVETLCIT